MLKKFVSGAGIVESAGGPRRLLIEQLADRWNLSVSSIRRKLYAGQIPAEAYFQIGGPGSRILFKEEAIERLERESA